MRRAKLALAIAIGAAACGGGHAEPDAPDTYIAFASSFAPFRTWTSFHTDGPADDGTFPADVLGPRTQYINLLPPHGASAFPVGTIIVEARESNGNKIFAGVKRGGEFNLTGAKDWEWFELQEPTGPGGEVLMLWRGVGPPNGETYGGDPNGGCNACHTKCGANNDYVCSPKLQLSTF
jgi:hypothetical protein